MSLNENSKLTNLIYGSLLHDIGKPVQRANFDYSKMQRHALTGCLYIGNLFNEKDKKQILENENLKDILDQIKYHHAQELSGANLPNNHNAYITYIADNISAGMDRRDSEPDIDEKTGEVIYQQGWNKKQNLNSIFNYYSHNPEKTEGNIPSDKIYKASALFTLDAPNYPLDNSETNSFTEGTYNGLVGENPEASEFLNELKNINFDKEHINSLIHILEGGLSYIPSSTSRRQVADISLFNHLKTTAGIASCIYQYLEEQNIVDYKIELFENSESFYDKECFTLTSFDISGIQNFIYTISDKNAAKSLRARSFYLEIFTENMIDNLLDDLGLTRANLLYSGGGHGYLLLPNTKVTKERLKNFEATVNDWLLDTFDTRLFVAFGSVSFAPRIMMMNKVEKSKDEPKYPVEYEYKYSEKYRNLYKLVSEKISQKKMNRYSPLQINDLNNLELKKGSHFECHCCKVVIIEDNTYCEICKKLISLSDEIINNNWVLITNRKNEEDEKGVPIFPSQTVRFEEKYEDFLNEDILGIYGKNKLSRGKNIRSKLWVGDYRIDTDFRKPKDFQDMAKTEVGINRLGVLRMDVDNLGTAFANGFKGKYNTFSRTSSFSNQMTLFFKNYINNILANPKETFLTETNEQGRNVQIIYSGGDDIFLVGGWASIVESAIDLRQAFEKYTDSKLTISGGIGIYPSDFPISAIADQVGELEEKAKSIDDSKDAICLFEKHFTFKWDVVVKKIIPMYKIIEGKFSKSDDRFGKSFIYKLLELLRMNDEISRAKWVYFLARNNSDDMEFNQQLEQWFSDTNCKKYLELALTLYVYKLRVN
jgi:CRISPR-associated protein Csm1